MQCDQAAHCSSQQPGGFLQVSAHAGLLATELLSGQPRLPSHRSPFKQAHIQQADCSSGPQGLRYCRAACVEYDLMSALSLSQHPDCRHSATRSSGSSARSSMRMLG